MSLRIITTVIQLGRAFLHAIGLRKSYLDKNNSFSRAEKVLFLLAFLSLFLPVALFMQFPADNVKQKIALRRTVSFILSAYSSNDKLSSPADKGDKKSSSDIDLLNNPFDFSGGSASSNSAPTESSIEDRFGVQMLKDSSSSHFYIVDIDGHDEMVLRSLGSSGRDWPKLEFLEKKMEDNLSDNYGIKVGHNGEFAMVSPTSGGPAQQLRVRSANLAELYALKSALEHSVPSQLSNLTGKSSVKVYFLVDWNNFGARADWGFDASKKPAIMVEPNPAPFLRYSVLQEALIHEFGHNSAYRLGFDMDNCEGWRLVKPLGWKSFFNPRSGNVGFAIITRGGKLYRPLTYERWIRCNGSGVALKEDGTSAYPRISQAQRLSTDEIREAAVIKPISSYFPNPMEMYAEGVSYFRRGEKYRKYLLDESPELYRLVKEQDQLELDKTYGKGKMVRYLNGSLIANLHDKQNEIREFESRHQVLSANSGLIK